MWPTLWQCFCLLPGSSSGHHWERGAEANYKFDPLPLHCYFNWKRGQEQNLKTFFDPLKRSFDKTLGGLGKSLEGISI